MSVRLVFRGPEEEHLHSLDVPPGATVGVARWGPPGYRVFTSIDGERRDLGVGDQSVSSLRDDDAAHPIEIAVFDGGARIRNNYNVDSVFVTGKYGETEVMEGETHAITEYADLSVSFNLSAAVVFPGDPVAGPGSSPRDAAAGSLTPQQRRTLRTVSDTRVELVDPDSSPERVARKLDELIGDVEKARGLDAADLSEFKTDMEYFTKKFDAEPEKRREELRRHLKRLEQELFAAFDGTGPDRS